jgi:hypothetical protein
MKPPIGRTIWALGRCRGRGQQLCCPLPLQRERRSSNGHYIGVAGTLPEMLKPRTTTNRAGTRRRRSPRWLTPCGSGSAAWPLPQAMRSMRSRRIAKRPTTNAAGDRKMGERTKIEWCDSTVKGQMGSTAENAGTAGQRRQPIPDIQCRWLGIFG